MNKSLLFFFALLFLVNAGFSQFQAGIKAGTDVEKLDGQSYSDQFAFGYHLGAYAQIPFSKKAGIQTEVYYSEVSLRKTSSIDPVYQNINLDSIRKIDLAYINVPILFYYKPSKHLALQIGPKYGLLSSTNLKTVGSEVKNALKTGDLSVVAGFQLNYSSIRIYARYQIGLSNLNDISSEEKWKTQSIHAGVGLRIF